MDPAAGGAPRLGRGLLLLMSVAICATASNLYYNQPLLPLIRQAFDLHEAVVGLVPAASQFGYALAILFISPLGDTVPRRTLIGVLSVVLSLALVGIVLAPSFPVLILACFVVGLGGNITQQLIPFGASLATPETRGQVIATLMTGLSIGLLLSRTISGTVAEYFGWRGVFVGAAIVAVGFGVLFQIVLPRNVPTVTLGYRALLGSMGQLVRRHRLLRETALTGALWFAAFNALWATLALHLNAGPFFYSAQQAGLFGLVGLAGILGAKVSGRLVGMVGARALITGALGLIIAAFGVMAIWGDTLGGMILGVVLLDLGVFGAQIPNQVRVFSIDPDAQSRIYAVYMLCYYSAAALGSAAGVKIMSLAGWHGLTTFGIGLGLAAGLYHLSTRRTQDAA